MRKSLLALAAGVLLLAAVLVVRARPRGRAEARPVPASSGAVDSTVIARRLAGALRFRTISFEDSSQFPESEFAALRDYLAEGYPRVHRTLRREIVGRATLLYTWLGTDSAMAPLVLMSHQDVVPVEAGTESQWTHGPFDGVVADGYVWGRGALDDKSGVITILEAVERLLERGERPHRSVILVFGHDEEIGGWDGAHRAAAILEDRGVKPIAVLDEGGAFMQGAFPGIDRPVAFVGVGEKSPFSVVLRAEMEGGHSSSPARESAVGILSAAVSRLERTPMPGRLRGASREMVERLAPEMTFGRRLVMSNLWLFRPLVERQFEGEPGTAAMLRTTMAPTIIAAGVKENVIPAHAEAVVNVRLMPDDSVAGVLAHIRRVVGDSRVSVALRDTAHPAAAVPLSPRGGAAWDAVGEGVAAIVPEALVVPYLLSGATDSWHFLGLTNAVYRFMPVQLVPDDLSRYHGRDERVPVAALAGAVRFYEALLQRLAFRPNG